MDRSKGADFGSVAVELFYLRETARAAGEVFLAYLIEMAALEAQRLCSEAKEGDGRAPEDKRLPA